jgi:hypothetical protein
MKIDKAVNDDYTVLTLKGEFDTFYCPALMQEVETLVERGVNHLVLDMRLVRFINSTALAPSSRPTSDAAPRVATSSSRSRLRSCAT